MAEPVKNSSVDSLVHAFLSEWHGAEIDQRAMEELRRFVVSHREGKPPSPARLLDILLSTDTPISRAMGGFAADLRGRVRIQDRDTAQASLIEMACEYGRARSAENRDRAADCRRAVLHGKKRLAFLLARPNLSSAKREEKLELQEWFRVWLEAPGLFETWVVLRRQNLPK
jgi:hypothetical protein